MPLRQSDRGPMSEALPYRVLLIDDAQEDRELLAMWLERTSRFAVVGEAEDGPRGVAMAADLRPDLVTLDMSMPGGDGITALRQIRALCPDSKVVMVSGFITDDLVHATVDLLGASAYLDKDIGPDRMVEDLLGVVELPDEVLDLPSDFNSPQALADREHLATSRLAAIVESSVDAIMSLTLQGVITSWNSGAEHMYGYGAGEVVGHHVSMLIAPERVDEVAPILERMRRGERVEHFESTRRRRDGSPLDISVSISPIRDASSALVGASVVSRDITARKLADAELARQAEDIRRSNEELEQFAYVASHDLSEPLRTISGFIELLAQRYKGQIDDDADRFIKHTVEGCSRMRQLIDDLLTYSRAGHADELTATNCSRVVSQVLTGMAATLAETGGQVDYEGLPTVLGDSVELAQLFQNLIANGIKFARPGIAPRVHIEGCRQADTWTISVADNGIGIEPEYRDRVFGMFQRLHARDTYPGTGIGLAICMRIVRAHRGLIWVDDNDEAGSRFCFTLPAFDEDQS
jgi:PAS domain S-box-containing protein